MNLTTKRRRRRMRTIKMMRTGKEGKTANTDRSRNGREDMIREANHLHGGRDRVKDGRVAPINIEGDCLYGLGLCSLSYAVQCC
jgi:hypothetical protein